MRRFTRILTVLLLHLITSASAQTSSPGTVWATPHDSYSSSVGVLGCKVNTDRIAYWPAPVSCNDICVSLSYQDRSVYLLRVDQSGGAYDVSYDAWNYLYTGYSAEERPTSGGAIEMMFSTEDPSSCQSLIHTDNGALPLSAANSMDFLESCLQDQSSWVGKNYDLYNILDPICTMGVDEVCTLDDFPAQNQPTCPHTLGLQEELTGDTVWNIEYPTGEKVQAGAPPDGQSEGSTIYGVSKWAMLMMVAVGVLLASQNDCL